MYFSWPQPDGGQSWQLLGTLSNLKPSAIFRISRLKSSEENVNVTNSFGAMMQNRTNAIVGISVEPLVNIEVLANPFRLRCCKIGRTPKH